MPSPLTPPLDIHLRLLDRRLAIVGFALVVLVFMLVFSLTRSSQYDRMGAASEKLRSLHMAEDVIRDIERDLAAMHSARRNFELNPREQLAQDLERQVAVIRAKLDRLESLIIDQLELQSLSKNVADLKLKALKYEAQLRVSIGALRLQELDPGLQARLTGADQQEAETLQAELQVMYAKIEQLYADDTANLAYGVSQARRREGALLAFALIALALALGLAWRQIVRRERAFAEVSVARAELEQQVLQRTKALSRALRRYRNVVELSSDVILLCNSSLRIQYANPSALSILKGLQQEAVIGQKLVSLVVPWDREKLGAVAQSLHEGAPKVDAVSVKLLNRNGAACPVELAVTAIAGQDSPVHQILVVMRDLRPQMLHEVATRDQLDFVEDIIEAMPLPLSLRDEYGRFTRVNRSFETLYGTDRASVLGHLPIEVLAPGMVASLEALEQGRLDFGSTEIEASWSDENGCERIVLVREQPLTRRDGNLVGLLSVQTEVTALRQQERELRLHAERLSELTSQLIAAQESERRHVARELHDQIGQILTALHLQLAAHQERGVGPSLAGPIELTEEALKHTRNLTASLHPHVLDDLGVKAALNWLFKRYILPSLGEVDFVCELVPERADPALELVVFRVVQEALTNVVRHAKASRAEVHLTSGDGWLRLDVSDDGEGFEAGNTWFDLGRETSLGVASMRERVEDLGGEFAIDSMPDVGTSLRVLLPWPTLDATKRGTHAGFVG